MCFWLFDGVVGELNRKNGGVVVDWRLLDEVRWGSDGVVVEFTGKNGGERA